MIQDTYITADKISLTPSKIALYTAFYRRDFDKGLILPAQHFRKTYDFDSLTLNEKPKVKRSFHNFRISTNAMRTLKTKINWLYYLAKPRTIQTYSKKKIFNFKLGFYTFTLPSKQQHPTHEITTRLFNQLLTELRQRTQLKNYVWRLEFQRNKNVHYHLVTDTYLDYFFIKKIWNRILSNAGYIKAYQEKHKKLSFKQYNDLYNRDGKIDKNKMSKRFARGKKEDWKNPNTVDVKPVVSKKAIAVYISKYFAKNKEGKTIKNDLDNEENSSNLRLWFCSRSLSKLHKVTEYAEAFKDDIFEMAKEIKDCLLVINDYVRVVCFDLSKAKGKIKGLFNKLLLDYAKDKNYIPSG